ncbi:MAG: class I SAM-dependent methyltransferase [Spirochaetaceae bacterium]
MINNNSSECYDVYHSDKQYVLEVQYIYALVQEHSINKPKSFLEVACGTGNHLVYFKNLFNVVSGAELSSKLLNIARKRLPKTKFFLQPMHELSTNQTFDVITALFNSIDHLPSIDEFENTIKSFSLNLNPDGLVIIDPGFTPENWRQNQIKKRIIERNGKVYFRMSTSLTKDNIAEFDEHYLVTSSNGTQHCIEHFKFTLFRIEELMRCLERNNFTVIIDKIGLNGRGLLIARKNT